MDNATLGIGACLGDPKTKEKALKNLLSYKRLIMESMRWFESQSDGSSVKRGEGYIIINAEDQVKASIIGTMASILSKSNDMKKGTLILSLADLLDGKYKVSLRVCGSADVDLRLLATQMASAVGGEAGGHEYAAGAIIDEDKVTAFLEEAEKILVKRGMEEIIR
jgi:nanoRNase/pAp phosphatase (c-di-AMP/oligoRNAs hydrolase)